MIDFHDILDRMNQNQRINFDKVFQRMARRWQQGTALSLNRLKNHRSVRFVSRGWRKKQACRMVC